MNLASLFQEKETPHSLAPEKFRLKTQRKELHKEYVVLCILKYFEGVA